MSASSVSTYALSALSDKYGQLFEDLVIGGARKHLGVLAGVLETRKCLTEPALLDTTRVQLLPAFKQLFQNTQNEWCSLTNQAKMGGDAADFQMLEADIWCTVQLDRFDELPIHTPSFTADWLGGGGSAGGRDGGSAGGRGGGSSKRSGVGLLICESTSSCDLLCLKMKICKMERLLEYAAHATHAASDFIPPHVTVIAALATEAAPPCTQEQLEQFVVSNVAALPRLHAYMIAGKVVFINIPGKSCARGCGLGSTHI